MLGLTLILSSALAAQAPPPAESDQPAPAGPIVVTGDRPVSGVEEPYPETKQVPLGSRIARKVDRRPFSAIASDTGVAGLFVGEGSHWDGTGGREHLMRMRRVKECVAAHEQAQVSEAIACTLYRVKNGIKAGQHAAAAEALGPLLERRDLTGWERYYVGHYALLLGEALDDDARRESALSMMLASGRMPAADQPVALRALAAMAMNSGDDEAAIARLEAAAKSAPGDVDSRVNLATLYLHYGREDQARVRMAEAVEIVRRSGKTPPAEWTSFLATEN